MESSSTAFKCALHMSQEISQGLRKSEDKLTNLSKYLNLLTTETNWPVRKRYIGVRNEVSNNY